MVTFLARVWTGQNRVTNFLGFNFSLFFVLIGCFILAEKNGCERISAHFCNARAPFEWEKMRKRKSWIKIFWSLGGRLGFYTSRALHTLSFWHPSKFPSRIRTDPDPEQTPKPYRPETSSESESARNRNLHGIGIRSDSGIKFQKMSKTENVKSTTRIES